MSKLNLKADALAAYERALNDPSTDWRSVAELLRAAIPTAKAKTAPAERADGFAPWADYPITRYKVDRVGPTCVVTFADGETCRMSTATLPGKPLNVARGVRLCVAAWESRARSGIVGHNIRAAYRILARSIMGQERKQRISEWLYEAKLIARNSPVPAITSCRFEFDGATIATFDPVDCNQVMPIVAAELAAA